MEKTGPQYVREYIVRKAVAILDNDQYWYEKITKAARDAVAGYAPGESPEQQRETFQNAIERRGALGYQAEDYAQSVGIAVNEVLQEALSESDDGGLCYRLLVDILDLSDSAQRDLFGEHYLPESADDVDFILGDH